MKRRVREKLKRTVREKVVQMADVELELHIANPQHPPVARWLGYVEPGSVGWLATSADEGS